MSTPSTLVTTLTAARKATQFYPAAHPRFVEAIDALVAAAGALVFDGPFVLNLHQGRLYSGNEVLTEDGPSLTSMVESMESRRIESFTFLPGFGEADARGLTEVLNLRPSPQLDVEAELAAHGVTCVQVARIVDDNAEEKEERDRERERDKALYRRFVTSMRTTSQQLQHGGEIDLTEAGGMVPELVSRLLENPAAVLGLATIRSQGEASLFHSINVMIYSLIIGAALELPEEGFASLGVSAMMHDVGKAVFEGTGQDDETVRLLHTKAGADVMSRLGGQDPAPMLVAFEHHMGFDGSGWPEREANYFPHPYSRMVAVADRYETLTKSKDGLTPDRAVAQILREAGKQLDPIFTRMFVQALGVFPIGCWVRLSDHTVGVVSGQGGDPLKPAVRLVYDDRGLELEEPIVVDLAGDPRDIVQVVDEGEIAAAAAEHL